MVPFLIILLQKTYELLNEYRYLKQEDLQNVYISGLPLSALFW